MPPKPPHSTSSASTYAAAAAATVSNTTATHGPNTAHATIYEQQMHGRIPPDQNSADRPGQGDSGAEQMQVDLEEYIGVDREGSRGHGEASGFTGGGFIGGVANVLGIGLSRAGPAPAPPNGKLEKEYLKAMMENNYLQEELRRTQRKLENYVAELQRANTEGRTYYRAARDLQHDNQRLQDNIQSLEHELSNVLKQYQDAKSLLDPQGKELVTAQDGFITDLVQKAAALQPFLTPGAFSFLMDLKALNDTVAAASNFLVDKIVFRASEAFSDELDEARRLLLPRLGTTLLHLLATHAQKSATVSDATRGSRILVRVASRTLLYRFCLGNESIPRSLPRLLRANVSMFKIGSWALAGEDTRIAFEAILRNVISAAEQFLSSLETVSTGISVFSPDPEAAYIPGEMGAVDPNDEPLPHTFSPDEVVVAALAIGVKKGSKVAIPPRVLLKSTLHQMLLQEEEESALSQPSTKQPDCDGLA